MLVIISLLSAARVQNKVA